VKYSVIFIVIVSLAAIVMGGLMSNKAKIIYSGQAFEIQTINGECYARDKKVWFGCNYFFKNKVLIRGAR